jgi:hypothetical protein
VLSHGQRLEHHIETLGDHGKNRARHCSAIPSSLKEILLGQRDAEYRGRETKELHVLDGYPIDFDPHISDAVQVGPREVTQLRLGRWESNTYIVLF